MDEEIEPGTPDQNVTLPVNKLMGLATATMEIDPFTGSLPPTIALKELKYSTATSTSVIPVAATGIDPDGSFEGAQFYVNGEAYGDPIFRPSGVPQDAATYSTMLDLSDLFTGPGIATIFAAGWDNSGNYVVSDPRSISITNGSTPAVVSSISELQSVPVDPSL